MLDITDKIIDNINTDEQGINEFEFAINDYYCVVTVDVIDNSVVIEATHESPSEIEKDIRLDVIDVTLTDENGLDVLFNYDREIVELYFREW